jgi:hypothetical protein
MGNKLGWIIAGLMIAGIACIVGKFVFFPSPSKGTPLTGREGALDLVELTVAIEPVLGFTPSRDADAGEDYLDAVRFYQSEVEAYDEMFDRIYESEEADTLSPADKARCEKLVAYLEKAKNKKESTFTSKITEGSLKCSMVPRGFLEIGKLVTASELLYSHYLNKNQPEKAKDIIYLWFTLGRHLAQERARVGFVNYGCQLMYNATETLKAQCYQDMQAPGADQPALQAMVQACDKLGDNVLNVQQSTKNRINAIWKLRNETKTGLHAGDIIRIIEDDKDPSGRVDAILALGYLKFTSSDHRGDTRVVNNLLEEYAQSDTPLYKQAAQAANALTLEQMHSYVAGH